MVFMHSLAFHLSKAPLIVKTTIFLCVIIISMLDNGDQLIIKDNDIIK